MDWKTSDVGVRYFTHAGWIITVWPEHRGIDRLADLLGAGEDVR